MVRNTVAIQTGEDPRTASIAFHWGKDSDGSPASFFPERGEYWYWPGHGIRLDEGSLIIFLYTIVATPGEGLGFADAGYAIAVIDNPDAPASTWNPRIIDIAPSTFDAVPATAVVRDGAYIVAVAIRQEGTHAGELVRYAAGLLAEGDVAADLVVTYATNSFDFWDLFAQQGACSLYWPRFVLVPVGE